MSWKILMASLMSSVSLRRFFRAIFCLAAVVADLLISMIETSRSPTGSVATPFTESMSEA